MQGSLDFTTTLNGCRTFFLAHPANRWDWAVKMLDTSCAWMKALADVEGRTSSTMMVYVPKISV